MSTRHWAETLRNLTLDATNNVEVIQVNQPVAGTWKAEVVGSNVPQGPQPFAWVAQAHCA